MTTVGDWRFAAVLRRARSLRGRSLGELRERAAQFVSAELERRGMSAASREPRGRFFVELLDQRVLRGASDGPSLREHFSSRSEPAFFAGIRDGASAREMETPRWAHARASLIGAAERVLAGRFDLLGHTGLWFGEPIDWHADPVSNKRAPDLHWSRIPYLDHSLVGDHKVVWELNRHQHFFVLGRAYQVTRDPRYAACFAEHVASWMDANTPKNGINWASSLEVSYRAIAWLWAIELFRDAPELTAVLLERMLRYLYVHGRHLERYLSTYFSPNTHLTGEALGLFYLGTMLPELRRASVWRERGWQILAQQLDRQIYDDGVYFEQATYYQRYTADIYLHAVILADRNGFGVPRPMRDRLALAIDHLAFLARGDGNIPVIGDDDGGRLVLLEERELTDVRAVLATSAVVLDRAEHAVVAGGVTEEVLWLLGPEGVHDAESRVGGPPPVETSKLFPLGGYAIMRSGWSDHALHAVVDCGPLGALNCGHAHADALSIDLAVGPCPLIVDPGTYTYTVSAEARDHFRHTAAHNTVTLNGEASSVHAGPFSWKHRAEATVEQWWTGSLTDWFVGRHDGFGRLGIGASHRRSVLHVRGEYWIVVDTVVSDVASDAVAHFHAAEGATPESMAERSLVLRFPCSAERPRLFFGTAGDVDAVVVENDWIPPSYGRRVRAPAVRVASRRSGERTIVTVLCPLAEGDTVSVTDIPASEGRGIAVSRPEWYDLLVLGAAGRAKVSGFELSGDAALLRRKAPGAPLVSVAVFGHEARLAADGDVFEAAGVAAEALRSVGGWTSTGGRSGAGSSYSS